MTLYKIITDQETFYVYAKDHSDAESIVIDEHFRELLDDDLSDFFTTEEVRDSGIISSI